MSHQNIDYVTLMHERGYRFTPQRQFILDAVCAGNGHTSVDEIFDRVHAKAPSLNRATVYRTLDFLRDMRLVVATEIDHQTLYEIAGETPHHHLVCRKCGSMQPLAHAAVMALFDQVDREQNFSVDMDHLTLLGLCQTCRGTSP